MVCCDNLIDNGTGLHGLIHDFCAALPVDESDELIAWLETSPLRGYETLAEIVTLSH